MIIKGLLRQWTLASYTATVEPIGALPQWMTDVPVARNIADAEMVAGRYVAVETFGGKATESVVIAVWV